MRHPVRSLALAACLALTGSAALAAPPRRPAKAKHASKPLPAPEVDEIEMEAAPARAKSKRKAVRIERDDADDDDEALAPPETAAFGGKRKGARPQRDRSEDADSDESDEEEKTDRVALRDADDEDEDTTEVIRPARLRKHSLLQKPNDWHVAIGPYVWASSVDAEVSLGSASVSSGVDFMDVTRHTRYGAELLAAVSYRRFKLSSDMMYGVIDLDGAKTVGPLMVSLAGTASSLLVDGNLSYRFLGDEQSKLSLEGLAGLRYQRTSIEGGVSLGGSEVASMEKVSNVADALAGARVYVRPYRRIAASGAVDIGVFGDSSLTWSASADASVRITTHVQLSLGYRALTMNGANVSMKMHGPRAALQLLF